jgi:hypothetical protein
MRKIKRREMTVEEIRRLLESGMLLRRVSALCGYTQSELSIMCRCWNIGRGSGRRKKVSQ